jgi:hypothetical protein
MTDLITSKALGEEGPEVGGFLHKLLNFST